MKYLLMFLFLLGCDRGVESPKPSDIDCHVVRFSTAGQPDVCNIECNWSGYSRGYSNTTPVSCEWDGRRIQRSSGR